MAQVIIRPHVLSDRDHREFVAMPGATLQDIADEAWSFEAHECVVLTVDGDVIPWEYWAVTKPKPGAVVRGTLTFGKSKGGKSILNIVATIAVVVASTFIAGPGGFAASIGVTSAAGVAGVAAGLTMVGMMAVNAIFKPTLNGPGTGVGYTDPKESNTYQISGQSNAARPYGVCPRLFGVHRMFPTVAASPFVVTEGANQFLYMLLDWGFGPLWVQDLQIGETPLDQYKDVEWRFINNFTAGSKLTLYASDVSNEPVSITLDPGIYHTRRTEEETVTIGLDFVFPRGLTRYNDQGNRTAQTVQLTVETSLVGSGVWNSFNIYGATTSTSGVALSSGVSWTLINPVRLATTATLFRPDGIDSRKPPRYGLPKGATSARIASSSIWWPPAIGNKIRWPNGVESTLTAVVNSGSYWTVSFAALTQDVVYGSTSGATLNVAAMGSQNPTLQVTAATSEPLYFSLNVTVPVGQYDVRVKRDTAAAPDTRTQNESQWIGFRSFANRAPIAPKRGHCIMELKIRASEQLSGVIQSLNGTAIAILPDWNGSEWVTTLTDRPAAAFLAVLKGSATRVPVPDSQIDYPSIQRWSEFCDRLDSEGQPMYRFSHIVDYSTTMYKMLNAIASSGRATLSYIDGKIGVIIDQEQTSPAQMFTPRNSWGFESVRTYANTPHAIRVTYNDQAQNFEQRQIYVYANGYDENNAVTFEDITAFGCTRYDQAWREGRYMLAQGLLRREQFSISADVENLACLRGDLVLVQHDVLEVGGDSSRISKVTSTTVFSQYDAIPTLDPGYTYGVRIRKQDGTYTPSTRVTQTGGYEWTLATAISGLNVDDLVVWGVMGSETGRYIVKEIQPGEDFTANLTLIEEAPGIYDYENGDIPPYKPPANGRPDGMLAQPPLSVGLLQTNYTVGRRPHADVTLSWKQPRYGSYHHYVVFAKLPNDSPVNLGTTQGTNFKVRQDIDLLSSDQTNKTIEFGVAAVDFSGEISDTTWVSIIMRDPLWVPDALKSLSSNVTGETTVLTWRDPDNQTRQGNLQIKGYDLRWSPDVNPTFETSTRVADLIAWPQSAITVPTRNGTYLIRPYTSSGVYATLSARTMTMTEALVKKDYYDMPRWQPAWTGTHVGTEVSSGELRLKRMDDGNFAGDGFWVAATPYSFNQVLTTRVAAYLAAYGYTAAEVLSSPKFTPLANAVPIGSFGGATNYDAKLWVSSTDPVVAPEWTFTRASVGSRFDATGKMIIEPANTPRIDYDPVTHEWLGLLMEEPRTNSLIQSSDFTSASWTKGAGATVATSSVKAPDGTNAQLLSDAGVALDDGQINQAVAITSGTATAYTMSVFLQKGTAPLTRISIYGVGGTNVGTHANITWSDAPTISTGTLQDVGGGWYRASVTVTTDVANTSVYARIYPAGGSADTTGDVYAWGAQLEAGAFISSYIPTTTAAVVRQRDRAQIPVGSWYTGPTEGTLVATGEGRPSTLGGGTLASLTNGTSEYEAVLLQNTSTIVTGQSRPPSSGAGALSNVTSPQQKMITAAFGYAVNNSRLAVDGVLGGLDTDCVAAAPAATLEAGRLGSAGYPANGHVKSIQYYQTRKTDDELVTLSQGASIGTPDYSVSFETTAMFYSTLDLTNARPIINGSFESDKLWLIVELRSFEVQTSPSVVIGGADLDFPEREEFYPDLPVAAGGGRVTFNYPFVAPPTVSITLQNAQPGEYVFRTNIDQYGFNVQVKNSAGVGVAGIIDVGVWGMGRVSPATFTVQPLPILPHHGEAI